MVFTHDFIPHREIDSEIIPGLGRFYNTPEGKFPSVTTVLGHKTGKAWLEEWKKKVGAEEAELTAARGKARGLAIHALCEDYLRNGEEWIRAKSVLPINYYLFKKVKEIFDERVGIIRGLEMPLYSKRLKVAGTTDFLGYFDGLLSIMDYKTESTTRGQDSVWLYHAQAACYGVLAEERYPGLNIEQVVAVSIPQWEDAVVHVAPMDRYRPVVEMVWAH